MTTRFTSPARRKLVATAALSLAASLATLVPAQSWAQAAWPNKPVRIVVPYAPGGANDILARVLAEKLSPVLGQPVLVENKPGAGAMVGSDFVAKAAPDGYTLLMAASGPMVFNPVLVAKLPYNPESNLFKIIALLMI
jgi:tripartite-type tricarboxylate transporter receptor subunit TctC